MTEETKKPLVEYRVVKIIGNGHPWTEESFRQRYLGGLPPELATHAVIAIYPSYPGWWRWISYWSDEDRASGYAGIENEFSLSSEGDDRPDVAGGPPSDLPPLPPSAITRENFRPSNRTSVTDIIDFDDETPSAQESEDIGNDEQYISLEEFFCDLPPNQSDDVISDTVVTGDDKANEETNDIPEPLEGAKTSEPSTSLTSVTAEGDHVAELSDAKLATPSQKRIGHPSGNWPLEQEERLRYDWESGKTAQQIADEYNLTWTGEPYTKSMVASKAGRMDLQRKVDIKPATLERGAIHFFIPPFEEPEQKTNGSDRDDIIRKAIDWIRSSASVDEDHGQYRINGGPPLSAEALVAYANSQRSDLGFSPYILPST